MRTYVHSQNDALKVAAARLQQVVDTLMTPSRPVERGFGAALGFSQLERSISLSLSLSLLSGLNSFHDCRSGRQKLS